MSVAPFSEAQWALLAGPLRLRPAAERDHPRSLPAQALFSAEQSARLLAALGPLIGARAPRVVASLLAKRVSFLATGACLYALSAYDLGLELAAENAFIEYGHDAGVWTSCMPLRRLQPSQPLPGQRGAWRQAVARELFAGLLQPLWESFHQATRLPRRILWENTAVRVYSLYERRLAQHPDAAVRAQARADLQWLVAEAPAEVFGLDHNPLQRFYHAATPVAEGGACVRVRRTCCFYYQASTPVEYCTTCPLLYPRSAR
ncbi:IucA/IucC family C-terminal-domain containing protein [Pseudomonas sp. NPDC007930]|uniref:IucA/IucC family C-terminal-domain containing protein n=1 Tax=Pseudomonas sp. NPDC007930 TaxID=3364417 RepID=UPI0036EA001C